MMDVPSPLDIKASTAPPDNRVFEEQNLRAGSHSLGDGEFKTEFVVPDMHCIGCISRIEQAIAALPQVTHVRANLSTRRVGVTWRDSENFGVSSIADKLGDLGFTHTVFTHDDKASDRLHGRGRELLMALAVAGFAAANIMLLSVSVWSGADKETAQLFHLISGLIAVPAVAFAGRPFFSSAWAALSVRRLNMDVPISLAVITALGMSLYESMTGGTEAYFDAAVTLLFFLLVGRYLDHLMRQKAFNAVEGLDRLNPGGTLLIEKDNSRFIPLDAVETGMQLRILPGERVPVDGWVVKGTSDIDGSLVTGESTSVPIKPGTSLEAGILNLTGPIEICATSTAENSFLAEMSKMMEAALSARGQYVRIAERMAQIYAPAVHFLALAAFSGWMIATGGDWHTSLYIAIAVLIVTCPCALGLAVPVSHVVAANRLFREGIMVRDGSALERFAEIDTVIFDKTGTLTLGRPHVTRVEGDIGKFHEVIHKLATSSSHPMAKAVAAFLGECQEAPLHGLREVPGFGIEARSGKKTVRLGRISWVLEIAGGAHELPDETGTAVAFAIENAKPVIFRLHDTIRPEAAQTINSLKERGLDLEIVSGDQPQSVSDVAAMLGIKKWIAKAVPSRKIDRIKTLHRQGAKVLMAGDGLNDAPALAAGHASIAPGTAADVGRDAADMVFLRGSLHAVPFAINIARQTRTVVRQNFALALLYNCLAVPLAMTGYVTPLVAAIAMSASSIIVVANSLRLNLLKSGFSAAGARRS